MLRVTTVPKSVCSGLQLLATCLFVLFLFTWRAQAAEISLAWDPSPSSNAAGYRIRYVAQGTTMTQDVNGRTTTSTTVSNGINDGTTYCFVAQAFDSTKTQFSVDSNQVCGTPAATAADTTAPSVPGNLAASAASSTQINLSWSASTDNVGVTGYQVERCQGSSCTNFTQIGTATGTTYSNTGLTVSTTYRFRVRATDAAGNLGNYSSIVNGTTPAATDTSRPSTPANLTGTPVSASQVNLAWTASTDNVGVTGYRVERCRGTSCTRFVQIATPTNTTHSDTGLSANTTYRYRVRATDAAGNLSSYSSIVNAKTLAAPVADSSAPTVPGGLIATAASSEKTINLLWTASTDNVGVTGTTYRYRVRATDAAGNLSGYSATASATTANTTSCTSNCTIWASTAVPEILDYADSNAVEVGLKFTSDVPGRITGIRFYKSSANTGTHIGNVWSTDGTKLASATFTNETSSGWQQVNFSTPVQIAANTVYVASYYAPAGGYSINTSGLNASVDNAPLHALSAGASGGNGVHAYGDSSRFPAQTWNASNYWVDVVFTAAADTSCTSNCTIWDSTAVPQTVDDGDWQAVELGVKFKADVTGNITGIRFYKGSANTGTHVGNLWRCNDETCSTPGTLVASATFSGETASGWQQVNFAAPVGIAANTMYVASYHAPVGHYSADPGGLTASVDRPPLHALTSGLSGGNGVYSYGPARTFPQSTWNDANYWVDVVFARTQ